MSYAIYTYPITKMTISQGDYTHTVIDGDYKDSAMLTPSCVTLPRRGIIKSITSVSKSITGVIKSITNKQ